MSDDRSFLGKGWRFPVAINLTGGISSSSLDENVRESIFIILGTAPGERVKRPDFGCRIHDLMFEPNNFVTSARAEYFCEEALYKYEPRLKEVTVKAGPNADEPNRLDIRITYVIIGQTHPKNLVYPFYLRKPDEAKP
ncbi:MAG: GPW/gp25 family protein [Kofleriaceae bacterium]|jgi:phage baseplate assembly protein W|nr:GPW/gp25 family protein [Kofleriaceae bacterium]MBP9171598.1 GPW/gp25 family protein [Kofleriaceae bacterium]MBP9858937.1 GPW/gp25 family protein [Kofleriaceae bacterium]